MTPEQKSTLLKTWALEAGFDRAGVAGLEPSDHGEAFLSWLERGEHAEMRYLERRVEARLDPRRLLDGARSVVCVALQYWPLTREDASPEETPDDLWSGVARYARGRDYHDLMLERLDLLAARISEAFPGSQAKSYVDTGPVLERELAARAGLGAAGKNTNLLHPEGGSYFLLGELFLTLDLEPDPRVADLCGSCTECLDLCPTEAFPESYRLDSNRCISYWTIEHRGAIPEEVRPTLGSWVFGCDVCQEVCPVNTSVGAVEHPDLELPGTRRELDLAGLLGLERDDYVERFRGSAMKRAKLEGLQRNAAVAMGNRGKAEYIEPLARTLLDGEADAVVRSHCAWALGRIGGEAARRYLTEALDMELGAGVREEIRVALAAAV